MRQSFAAPSGGPPREEDLLDVAGRFVAKRIEAKISPSGQQFRGKAVSFALILLAVPAICCLMGAVEADRFAPPSFREGFRWLCIAGAALSAVAAGALFLWLDDKARFLSR
jgi:hypothetical protein